MAEFSSVLSQDQLTCPICLELLTDPSTIPCGHTYCLGCIKRYWDEADQKGVYRCPECRETFSERPALNKNTMFTDVVERLRETGLQPAPVEHAYPGPEDPSCDVCTGRQRLKATQSCLTCLASYCELHLSLHNELSAGNKHKVISATTKLQESICLAHNKLMDVYCLSECQFICYLCAMSTHKEHDTIPVAERVDKQRLLGVAQTKSLEKIQRKERETQDLRKGLDSFKESAQACVADCERAFRQLIECAERSCSEVTELIRDQEEAEKQRAAGLLERLEQESREMRERDAVIRKLAGHTDDHIYFIQHFPAQRGPNECEEATSVVSDTCCDFRDLRNSISDLQKQLQKLCQQGMQKVLKGDEERERQDESNKTPLMENGGVLESVPRELEWRRQKSEEWVPTHQHHTPPVPWRRRRASSEEAGRAGTGQAQSPCWRRWGQERRAREESPCAWRRSATPDGWRTQPHSIGESGGKRAYHRDSRGSRQ